MKILPSTWQASLNLQLSQLVAESSPTPRIAIVGIGNQYRCDDAAGILIARTLSQYEFATEHILICEAGHAPENITGELRKFAPNLVLLVDAAEMGKEPGTIEWIREEEIDGMSASTHSLPLSMLALYLRMELNCKVSLLGIQPKSNEVGETVSEEVLGTIDEVVTGLGESLRIDTLSSTQA